jgi:hypothetical protein
MKAQAATPPDQCRKLRLSILAYISPHVGGDDGSDAKLGKIGASSATDRRRTAASHVRRCGTESLSMSASAVDAGARPGAAYSAAWVSLLLAGYVALLGNFSFWRSLRLASGTDGVEDIPFVLVVASCLLAWFWLVFCVLGWRRMAKPVWIGLLVVCAAAAYFMDNYGIVIDRVAIQSVVESDRREASEWLSWRMFPYVAGALIPIVALLRLRLARTTWQREVATKLAVVAVGSAVIAAGVFSNFSHLASLARNHRELQHLINPSATLQASYGYLRRLVAPHSGAVVAIDIDAHRGASWSIPVKPRLLVLVVGESARAGSFSLLGYRRDTNPRLAMADVVAFGNWDRRSIPTSRRAAARVSLTCSAMRDCGRCGSTTTQAARTSRRALARFRYRNPPMRPIAMPPVASMTSWSTGWNARSMPGTDLT